MRTESPGEEQTPPGSLSGAQCQVELLQRGPLCCSPQYTAAQILQLQTGPTSRGGRCSESSMDITTSVCLPPIHSSRQSPAEEQEGEGASGGVNSTSVAEPALVSVSAGECVGLPNYPSRDPGLVGESSRGTSHTTNRAGPTAPSRLECLRASISERGFSEEALILSPPPGDRAQKEHMQVHGGSGATGVRDGRWISFQPL